MMRSILGVVLLASACSTPPESLDVSRDACSAPWAYSAEHNGSALLIVRNGTRVCERYAADLDAAKPHALYSGTKGFNGMMAAAAVADGLLTLDEKASDTLTEWRGDPLREPIKIRHLLSLSSGLATTGPRAAPGFREAAQTPGQHPPGEHFAYGPIVFQTFGEILTRKLAAKGLDPSPTAYLERRILDPLSISVAQWGGPTAGSDPNLAAGANMSAADWAVFGELVRDPARARALKLEPTAYEAQFKPQGAYAGYGLTWWLATPLDAEAREGLDPVARSIDLPQGARAGVVPADLVVAAGAGGQRLYISRSLGLVVVRFADVPDLAARFARAQDPASRSAAAVGSGQFSDTAFMREVLAAIGPSL